MHGSTIPMCMMVLKGVDAAGMHACIRVACGFKSGISQHLLSRLVCLAMGVLGSNGFGLTPCTG